MKITTAQAAGELSGKNNILILTHASPDGDTLGCAFALWHALTALSKRVRVVCPDPFPARFSFLYEGYRDESFQEEYVVAVDVAALQLLGSRREEFADRIDLCIDHHPSNGLFAAKTCLLPEAAACCEIIEEIIRFLAAPVTQVMANCLYTGIATDTGCFKFPNTSANTHRVAAEMFECGADYREINEFLFDTKSKSRISIERQVLDTMEFFAGDRIAVVSITRKMIEETRADESELDGISAIPRMIEGVLIGITIREKQDGSHKVSVRTTSEVDASRVCAVFGGGGHARAAGCQLQADYAECRRRLVEAAEQFLPAASGCE